MERCDMLRRYGREFTTVEIADTFWGVPPEPSVRGWHDAVPDEFSFALRVPQQVTHDRRFRDTGPVLGRFLARVSLLGGKLGPLLLTSPRGFQPTTENRQALRRFVEGLPQGFRWALEFPRADWLESDVLDCLRGRSITVTLTDSRLIRRGKVWELALEPTADFAYLRWNGLESGVGEGSREAAKRSRTLARWASLVRELQDRVQAVYGYIRNREDCLGPGIVRQLERLTARNAVLAAPRSSAQAQ
jgi:uncharacterized protein YecE (DUF72 family)